MLNLNPLKIDEKVSLNSLLTLRNETLKKEVELRKQMAKFHGVYNKPDEYTGLKVQMGEVKELLSDIKNCISIYAAHGNISGNAVVDDRPEKNNIVNFEKRTKKSFDPSRHELSFLIITNRLATKYLDHIDGFKGTDEYVHEEFECKNYLLNGNWSEVKTHDHVIKRYDQITDIAYIHASHFRNFLNERNRIVYGYVEGGKFYETGKIS